MLSLIKKLFCKHKIWRTASSIAKYNERDGKTIVLSKFLYTEQILECKKCKKLKVLRINDLREGSK